MLGPGFILCCESNPPLCRGIHINACGALESRIPETLIVLHAATSGGKHSPVLHSLSLFRCFILQHLEENILQSYTLSLSFVVSYCNIWRKTFSSLTLSLSLSLFHTATSGGKHSMILHLSVSSLHTATSGGKHSSSLSCLFHSPSQTVSSCFQS